MGAIWAIILAAGESKRMGFPKMLLPFKERTMIEMVIANVTSSYVERTLVVLGAERDSIRDKISNKIYNSSVTTCYNDNYKEGMLSSVKCGFRNLPSDIEAVLVFQGDQPFITPLVINTVISAYRSSGKGMVVPVYEKKRGHPLLIDMKYRNEIERLSTNEGLRSLVYKFADDVIEVEVKDSGILRDFDTYEEYQYEINQTG